MPRWQEAPAVESIAQGGATPRWASAPEAPPRQGIFRNALNAFNEGLLPDAVIDGVGFERSDPQTQGERIAAGAGRFAGQSATMIGGIAGLARALPGLAATATPSTIATGEGAAQSLLQSFRGAPLASTGSEFAAAAGAGTGGQIAREMAPDSESAEFAGEVIGGLTPASMALAPSTLAIKAGKTVANRLAPAAQQRAAREAAGKALGAHLTPEAQQGLVDAERLRKAIPGFEPSLAEATESPALVATQRALEGKAEGAELERYAGRHARNAQAVQQYADNAAPVGEEGAAAVITQGQRRIDALDSRTQQQRGAVDTQREDLAFTLPIIDRAGVGESIRGEIKKAKDQTRRDMSKLADELGINDADVSMEFGPVRANIEKHFRPQSVLEDETKIPGAVNVLGRLEGARSPILGANGKPVSSSGKTLPVTFKDLRVYRERIGDDLRNAQSSATSNRGLVRNLVALRKQVDDAVDQLAESASPELTAKYKQFRDTYYQQYVQRFERGAISKVNEKDHGGFYRTADEKVAEAFFARGNVSAARQFRAVFGDSPEAAADVASTALDSLRNAAVRDGVLDERLLNTWRRQHASVLDEFPTIRTQVETIGNANQALIERQTVLASRNKKIEDSLLARELQAVERGTKTPDQIIESALKSSRKMAQIVKTVSGYPEAYAGLRRALWTQAQTGNAADTAAFMGRHERTLKQVLSPQHWESLVVLQKARVMLGRVGAPRGRGVQPEPLRDIQNALGMGVNQLASRIFAAETGRTSWRYITIDALGHFLRGRSQAETAALFNQALYDPRVARAMAEFSIKPDLPPIAMKKLRAWLWEAGLGEQDSDEQ